jgi:hypothetical protein
MDLLVVDSGVENQQCTAINTVDKPGLISIAGMIEVSPPLSMKA